MGTELVAGRMVRGRGQPRPDGHLPVCGAVCEGRSECESIRVSVCVSVCV